MANPISKIAGGVQAPTGPQRPQQPQPDGAEGEKQRLRKAAEQFESLFLYQLLKTMRKTIPKNQSSEPTLLSGGLGKDTFTEMFDMELAGKMADAEKTSLAGLLYKSLEPIIDAQFRTGDAASQAEPIKLPDRDGTPLQWKHHRLPLPSSQPIRLLPGKKTTIPLAASPNQSSPEPIMRRFGAFIEEAARQNSLDSSLIHAVIKAESDGDPQAVSSAGAKGLMQLSDSTAHDYGVRRVFDPEQNIQAGTRYLKDLLDRFGDLKLALAAYNAGPKNVERYRGVPPFPETRAYVQRVTTEARSLARTRHGHHAAKVRSLSDR